MSLASNIRCIWCGCVTRKRCGPTTTMNGEKLHFRCLMEAIKLIKRFKEAMEDEK